MEYRYSAEGRMVAMTDERVRDIRVAEFGARLKQAREAADLNETQLAAMIGVTQSAISKWESKRKGDSPGEVARHLDNIETRLGLPKGELHRAYEHTFGRYGAGVSPDTQTTAPPPEEDDAVALIQRIKAELSLLESLLDRS